MGKIKRMDQIKLILQTYQSCGSFKGTSRRLQYSKNTIKQYVRQAEQSEYTISELLALPSSDFDQVFSRSRNQRSDTREAVFERQVDHWLKELRRPHVTRQQLWEEYRAEYPEGYSRTQFCDRLRWAIARRDLSLAMEHKPGEYLQLDFAGKKMHWIDPYTGEQHDCEVLVAVLPHSHYTFAIALPSQKVMDFVHGINQALLFFGKLPKVILSDNLRSFVKRADRYDPTFNDLCVQLATHYEVDLQATRAGKPKDKASVENAVRTVYHRIYAPLRNEVFHNIDELNAAICGQLALHNEKPFKNKTGSRRERFEEHEVPAMRELPSDLFEVKRTVSAKIQRNYHVYLGERKNYYSVPYQYAMKRATVVYDSRTVEIYIAGKRVATHQRFSHHDHYRYRTEKSHMPKSHQEWEKAKGYDAAHFLAQAEKAGPATRWAIGQALLSRSEETHTYRSCQGILSLGKRYGTQRLEQASLRCQAAGKANYSMLKRILELRLDQQQQTQGHSFATPDHENIRGPEAYQ